jgi:hypothetical protein
MSTAVFTETEAAIRRPKLARSAQRLFEPSRSTLEDSILGAWEDLAAAGLAECPVCRDEVLTAAGCSGCGSHLS